MSEQVTHNATLELFRDTFRRHAGGVVVVTGLDVDGDPAGFTATSLASLSAVPARATVNVMKHSSGFRTVRLGNRVAVNFLGADAQHLGELFAGPYQQRFVGDHWTTEHDLPILPDARVMLVTEIVAIHDHGDNAIVVLEIRDGRIAAEKEPLLYHDRQFGTVAALQSAAA